MRQRTLRRSILRMALLCGILATMPACRQENAIPDAATPVEQLAVEEPPAEEPPAEESSAEESSAEESSAEESSAEESPAEESSAEESPAEEASAEESSAEESALEEPAVEEPMAEEPAGQEPAAGEPQVEEPAVEESSAEGPATEVPADGEADSSVQHPLGDPEGEGIVRMAKDYDVWIDSQQKRVLVDGEVCLREGQLEMFACPKGTKEHESIVAVNCPAKFIHAALEAVGAKAGQAVQFDPAYQPATGPIVDVTLQWKDDEGQQHEARAQEWIQEGNEGKEMAYSWVFAGSGFWTDEQTGVRHYQADGGDLICVSNFPSATLDLPIESSQANTALLFSAFTERIPPLATKVRMVLTPRLDQPAAE